MASTPVQSATPSMLRDKTSLGFTASVVLHVAVVFLAIKGVPFLTREITVEETPIIIDLVPIEEITAAAPEPTPEPPKPEPEPVVPEPPKPAPAENQPSDAMPPPPEQAPPPKPEPKPDIAMVKPPPRKPTPPDTKKRDVAMLQDLLKDMQKNAPKPKPQEATQATQPSRNVAPNVSDRASMTELDAIRRHIEGCWRIDPGQEGVENMAAEVKVYINQDGSVQKVDILDMARYFVDPAFRTFANSARNAVLGCGNIPISAQRYNVFKEIVMTFSPQGRIN